ncbi:hypothetical protein J6590_093450, partial [Homalodisca vitripennis]
RPSMQQSRSTLLDSIIFQYIHYTVPLARFPTHFHKEWARNGRLGTNIWNIDGEQNYRRHFQANS